MGKAKIIRGVFNTLVSKLGTKPAKKAASKKIKSKIISNTSLKQARAIKSTGGSAPLSPGASIRETRAAARKASGEGKGSIGRAKRRAGLRVKANEAERATQLSKGKRGAEVAERQAGKNVININSKRIEKQLDKLNLKGDSRARVKKLMENDRSQATIDRSVEKITKKFTKGK